MCVKIRSRPAMCKNAHPFLWQQNWFIEHPKIRFSLYWENWKKWSMDARSSILYAFSKSVKCRIWLDYWTNCKNAEIFHKNIFIPFLHVVLGPKRFLGGLPHNNRKSKKFWAWLIQYLWLFYAKETRGVPFRTLLV